MNLLYFIEADCIDWMKRISWPNAAVKPVHTLDLMSDEIRRQMSVKLYWHMVHDGLKLFRCSQELWEFAGQLDMLVAEFKQSYPAMAIQFPDGRVVTSCQDEDVILMQVYTQPVAHNSIICRFEPEAAVSGLYADGAHVLDLEAAKRALKINTLICYFGAMFGGWAEPKEAARSERSGRFKERNIQLVQTIDIVANASRYRSSIPTGRTLTPHPRRGHMRHCGKQRILREIKPTFVNAKRLPPIQTEMS